MRGLALSGVPAANTPKASSPTNGDWDILDVLQFHVLPCSTSSMSLCLAQQNATRKLIRPSWATARPIAPIATPIWEVERSFGWWRRWSRSHHPTSTSRQPGRGNEVATPDRAAQSRPKRQHQDSAGGGTRVTLEACMAEWTQSTQLHGSSASTEADSVGRVHPQRVQSGNPHHAGNHKTRHRFG